MRTRHLVLLAAALFAAAPAPAAVILGGSNAGGIQSSLTVEVGGVATALFTLPLQPLVTGAAPAPYNRSDAAASVAAGSAAPLPASTLEGSALAVQVSSTVDGVASSGQASGAATVADLSLLVPGLGLVLGAEALAVTADVTGSHGALVGTASASLANLQASLGSLDLAAMLSGNGILTIDLARDLGAGASGLLTLAVGEEYVFGNGVDLAIAEASALRLNLDDVSLDGGASTYDGLLRVAVAAARLEAVPATSVAAPSPLALLLVMGAVALLRLRGRRP